LHRAQQPQSLLAENRKLEEASVNACGDDIFGAGNDARKVSVLRDPGRPTDSTADAGDGGFELCLKDGFKGLEGAVIWSGVLIDEWMLWWVRKEEGGALCGCHNPVTL
jgi:hypothetical protein